MIISDKSLSATKSLEVDVKTICEPLFKNTNITYLHYAKIYKDGSGGCLSTNPAWHQYWFEQNFHLSSKHIITPGFCLTSATPEYSQEVADARNLFNIDHKFEITECYDGHYEGFGFATHARNDKIIDFYFNKLDILKQYSLYFKDKAAELIKLITIKENRFNLTDFDSLKSANKTSPLHEDINNLIEDKIKRYFIDNSTNTHLTKREMECFIMLLKGRTAKYAAKELQISPKTVEDYWAIIKKKLNCSSKPELFDKAQACGLLDLIYF